MEKLELHYYLEGGVHSMDAFVKNKSEAELLKILKEVSDVLELDLSLEIEALEEGGVKGFIKFVKKKKTRKQALWVLAFLSLMFRDVVTDVISNRINTNQELEQIEREERLLHIKKLKKELEGNQNEEEQKIIIENITVILLQTDKIRLHRSKLYTTLLEEPRLYQISSTQYDENNQQVGEEKIVSRPDFKKFIIDKIPVDSEEIEDAHIEIVAPVLKLGKIKWRGIYNSESISFNLNDTAFKNQVLNKEISFTGGTAIKCTLLREKEMDDDGEIKVTANNVYNVIEVFQGTETIETKTSKRIKEERKQISMDFREESDTEKED